MHERTQLLNTDFCDISNRGLLLKCVMKIAVWLELDTYNRHFTSRPKYIYNISPNSSRNKKIFREKQNTHFA
jgi:hypothetical protein